MHCCEQKAHSIASGDTRSTNLGDDKGKCQNIFLGVCVWCGQVDKCSTVDQIYAHASARHCYSVIQQQHIRRMSMSVADTSLHLRSFSTASIRTCLHQGPDGLTEVVYQQLHST